jgi:hypothetical protein
MTEAAAASPDASSRPAGARVSPFLVVLMGWILPGAGYWLIGQRTRGIVAGLTILFTFLAGTFIGGIRVVDVPGYAEGGQKFALAGGRKVMLGSPTRRGAPRWALLSHPMPTVLEKPWYIGQILAGPVALVASYYSLEAARSQVPKATAHVAEFGTLYCAIAGMLNLLIIIDSAARAAGQKG